MIFNCTQTTIAIFECHSKVPYFNSERLLFLFRPKPPIHKLQISVLVRCQNLSGPFDQRQEFFLSASVIIPFSLYVKKGFNLLVGVPLGEQDYSY